VPAFDRESDGVHPGIIRQDHIWVIPAIIRIKFSEAPHFSTGDHYSPIDKSRWADDLYVYGSECRN